MTSSLAQMMGGNKKRKAPTKIEKRTVFLFSVLCDLCTSKESILVEKIALSKAQIATVKGYLESDEPELVSLELVEILYSLRHRCIAKYMQEHNNYIKQFGSYPKQFPVSNSSGNLDISDFDKLKVYWVSLRNFHTDEELFKEINTLFVQTTSGK